MSISEEAPLTSLAIEDSKPSKLAREVKDRIIKFGETASAQINSVNSHAGYDVVDSGREYAFPSAPKFWDYPMHPIRSFQAFGRRLIRNFGWRFCILLVVMYYGVKGLLLSVTRLVQLSYCKKTLNIDGMACQTMGAIASTPWALKGAIGVLSDAYPCCGYHKAPSALVSLEFFVNDAICQASYIFMASLLGTGAFLGLAMIKTNTVMASAVLLLCTNLEIAMADLLCQGKYAELMQKQPHTGSTMVRIMMFDVGTVAYVWGLFQLGSLTASLFVGPVADAFDPQVIFWVCVPVAASIVVPVGLGFLQDHRVPDQRRGLDWGLIQRHPYILAFCLIMAVLAIGNAIVDTVFFFSPAIQLSYTLSSAVILSGLSFYWLPVQLARCNFYMFISRVLYVSVGGAQDFWFTADSKCVPGGPHFDYTYYNTYTAIVGASVGWISIIIFQATMSSWPFRRIFWVTTILQVIASIYDILIINRLNLAFGISDKAFYLLGDAVLEPMGLEATVYALLVGFHNFGSTVSNQIGLFAIEISGIKTTSPCNFENLSSLILICHCLLPLCAIPLTFLLIPDKSMTDQFLDEDSEDVSNILTNSAASEDISEIAPIACQSKDAE